MDHRYFEFWGQLFLNMAKGQKQFEDADTWFRQAFKGYEPLTSLFKQAYGLDHLPEDSPESMAFWKNSIEIFQKIFRESLALLDVVPREDYLALRRQCDALEKKVAEQEETIRHLTTLWGQKENPAESVTSKLQTVLTNQQAEYQKMLEALGLLFQEKKKAPNKKKP